MRLAIVLSVLILSSPYNRTNAQQPAPSAFEEALDRGKSFYRSEQYQAAEEVFQEVISQSPHLPRAHHWLGLVFSVQGRDAEAAGQLSRAEQAYTEYLSQLDATERLLFEDLTYVTPVDTIQQQQSRTMQAAYRQTFWASRDPDPLTPVNERLLEHYRRIIYARENFSHNQKPWDTRGDIYIRYGEPDDRQRILLERIVKVNGLKFHVIMEEDLTPTGDARVDWIRGVHRIKYTLDALSQKSYFESWIYVRLDYDFTFLAPYFASPFDFPPVFGPRALGGQSQKDRLIARTPEDYPYDYGGELLDTVSEVVTFKGMKDNADTYALYNVPLRQLGTQSDSLGTETWITGQIALQDSLFQTVHRFSQPQGPVSRPVAKNDPRSLIASLSFMASAGAYQAVVKIRDKVTRRFNVLKGDVLIPDYSREELIISDLLLATDISSEASAGSVVRNELNISPSVGHIYHRSQPLYLYYEIYNLNQNAEGRTAYQTEIRITKNEVKARGFWGKVGSAFRKVGNLLSRASDEQSVLLTFEDEGASRDTFRFPTIDTAELSKGAYSLTLTIADQHTGQSFSKTTEFTVK